MVFTTKALEGIMYWVPCIIIYDTVLHIIQYTLREEGKRTRDLVKWERKNDTSARPQIAVLGDI